MGDYRQESPSFSVERVTRVLAKSVERQKDEFLDKIIDEKLAGKDTNEASSALEKLNRSRPRERNKDLSEVKYEHETELKRPNI